MKNIEEKKNYIVKLISIYIKESYNQSCESDRYTKIQDILFGITIVTEIIFGKNISDKMYKKAKELL